MNIIEQIALKFASGNSVPVQRATITAEEFSQFRRWVESKEMECDIAEHGRRQDNSYLIARAEKAEAERDTWRAMYDDAMASGARLQRSAEALLQVAGMGGVE